LTLDVLRAQDPRSNAASEPLGRVVSISGSQAGIGLTAVTRNPDDPRATVGKFVGIKSGKSLLVGVITDVSMQPIAGTKEQGVQAVALIDMMGEIKIRETTRARFQRGVTDYPAMGDPAALLSRAELRAVFDLSDVQTIDIGHLQHDVAVGALVKIDDMLSKHFAILGTTGVGKSSGVVLILRAILQARPELRIFLVDAHNEYSQCFGERAQVLNPRNLKLPFWLFNFEETVDIIFGGRPGVDEEVEILSEVIPLAKGSYTQYRGTVERSIKKAGSSGFTADTPVPYRLADLLNLIDERMGKLENRSSRMNYHRLIQRIETVSNDPRYAFMFDNANVGGDTMAEVLSQVFRLPPNGVPMTIMQLAGFPAEVVDAVVSVLCRMAFDFGLWSDGASPLLLVCEEAHRYASADRAIGFGPTRRAISRIAKEGRKYGVYLGLVTQRPAELDPTIISQCSTLFVMRMSNDRDQAILRSAVSDAAANLLAFVPSLGTREVIAFGEGVALPTRLKFKELPPEILRKWDAVGTGQLDAVRGVTPDFLGVVLERWRGATMSRNLKPEDAPDLDALGREDAARVSAAPGLDPNRFKILKKPTEGRADVFATSQWDLNKPTPRTPSR
jgi:DNA helicase HerA-like ATPase